jgi:glucokinase
MPDYSVGVDLGGTNLRIAAVTRDGQLLEKVTVATRIDLGAHHVVDNMCDAIRTLSDRYRKEGAFLGAGIGVAGIIDLEAGIVRKSANLPGWENYHVRDEIEKRLGARIFLENDAKVAALGEQWLGAGRNVANMAMLTLGTGIGGAIVLDGKIFHGMNGMAGEFGHVTVEPEGFPCGCGNRGCAERYASATGLVRMAREAIESGQAPELAKAASSEAEFSARLIYDLAMHGDEAAQRIFRRFGRALGILLADIVNVLNLPVYVVGGGVASAWDAFAPSMFEEVRSRSLIYAATAPEDSTGQKCDTGEHSSAVMGKAARSTELKQWTTVIKRALLGGDAGLFGGARLTTLE